MELSDQGPAIEEADVRLAEIALGVPLPRAMRAFYLAQNGGHPSRRVHWDGRYETGIEWFLPLGRTRPASAPEGTVEATTMRFRERGLVTPDEVVFGRDGGGNALLLDRAGQVLYRPFDVGEEMWERTRLVAPSFERFVAELITEDEAGFSD